MTNKKKIFGKIITIISGTVVSVGLIALICFLYREARETALNLPIDRFESAHSTGEVYCTVNTELINQDVPDTEKLTFFLDKEKTDKLEAYETNGLFYLTDANGGIYVVYDTLLAEDGVNRVAVYEDVTNEELTELMKALEKLDAFYGRTL